MTILSEILDRVKLNDSEKFRVQVEAMEDQTKQFNNAQGRDNITDIYEKKLAEQQMTFTLEEEHPRLPSLPEGVVASPSAPADSGSDVYKKFLDQLK
jgi:hypothetical protein